MDAEGHPVGWESFRCAPGPMGWRYVSTIETSEPEPHQEVVDLAVDGSWRPVRLRVDTGAHTLRLGATGPELELTLDGGRTIRRPLDFVDYASPCFNVAAAKRLRETADIEVLFLDPYTCEPSVQAQRYELEEEDEVVSTAVGRFAATRWRFTALDTGWNRAVWLAEEVVVRYEGLYELVEYDPGAGPFPR
jgi:hypothetical protein